VRVVLHEWSCSGGAGPGAAPPPTIVAEGRAMLRALAADAARDASLAVTVLIDERLVERSIGERLGGRSIDERLVEQIIGERLVPRLDGPGGPRVRTVPAGAELDVLCAEAARADWTLIVAPETDGLLEARVRAARAAGGRVAACGPRFIAVAGDKQATATALAAAGVPVPAGRPLQPHEPLPEGFRLPAVCKPRDGCGGEDLVVIRDRSAAPPATRPQRLEAFAVGLPVGVSCLCGPAGVVGLEPVIQRFAGVDRSRYLGGDSAGAAPWRARAVRLAERAVAAVARAARDAAAGWVGVDMIVGAADDGRDDRVLEVNPRLTTSFVGLAALAEESLLSRLLAAAAGAPPQPHGVPGRSVTFDATGSVEVRDD